MSGYKLGANGETVRVINTAPVVVSVPNEQSEHMQLCMKQGSASDFLSRSAGADLADGAGAIAFIIMIVLPTIDATCCIVDYLAQ